MQKRLVLLLLLFTMIISCNNPATPNNGGIDSDDTIIGGNVSDLYLPDLTPPGGIIEEPVYDLPPIWPVQPGRPFYPEYPGDPGTNYGGIIEVVTPLIYAENNNGPKWGTVWKIREKDSKRADYLWTKILETFESDNLGLGVVFGKKFESSMGGEPKHPDLKYAKPDTMRMYRVGKNFHQPFFKHVRDFGTYRPNSSSMIKQYKGAVIVGIDTDPLKKNGAWVGKYTIGGVYYNVGRLAYGNGQGYNNETGRPIRPYEYKGEDNFQTAGTRDEEIMVIRTDMEEGDYYGKKYYKIDLLFLATEQFSNRGVVLNKSKIHRYSDSAFRSCNFNNPYLYAMRHSYTRSLQRK